MKKGLGNSPLILGEQLFENLMAGQAGLPKPGDSAQAMAFRARWRDEMIIAHPEIAHLPPPVQEFLCVVAELSPFLRRSMVQEFIPFEKMMAMPMGTVMETIIDAVQAATLEPDNHTRMRLLRQAKTRCALFLALADLGQVVPEIDIMQSLSDFADACIACAFKAAISQEMGEAAGIFDLAALEQSRFGISIFAMGKLGAGELNYSSDIDLIILFDPTAMPFIDQTGAGTGPRGFDLKRFMRRVTHQAVGMLNDQTEDGYVFRTDLRLRPNPSSTPAAISLNFAARYYEMSGQNWERAAYIKARFVTGDPALGKKFLEMMRPFIWRKYLDYAAIEDIHSIKRQIYSVKGGGDIEFDGHDLKLGRGGIREIEFFVQTQQLILGGKHPQLRSRETLQSLEGLCAAGQINRLCADQLRAAYLFLRNLEHRLQMIEDAQTHKIPTNGQDQLILARLSGFSSIEDLAHCLKAHLRTVQNWYAALFEEAEDLSVQAGSLVFTGVENDPETLKTLEVLGFDDAETISTTIRQWHMGKMRATRSVRGRELLTRLVPSLLVQISDSDDPDATFKSFARFLEQLPAGVQVFSLFLNKLPLMKELIDLINLSPPLGARLANHSYLIENLLHRTGLAGDTNEGEAGSDALSEAGLEEDYEFTLNQVRRAVSERKFKTNVAFLTEQIEALEAGREFASTAEQAVRRLSAATGARMVQRGNPPRAEVAIIALGRLGARALTTTSDLDLIFVYAPLERAKTDQPMDAATWVTRYVRRLVTGLSVQTQEGGLYEIDMQLRPSGRAGPIAVSYDSFHKYYHHDAWIWERMALLKARVIYGAPPLAEKLSETIAEILRHPLNPDQVRADILDMRKRLLQEKPPLSDWDIKRLWGGLTDIDFIIQALSLLHPRKEGRYPCHMLEALAQLESQGHVSRARARELHEAGLFFDHILHFERASVGGVTRPEDLQPRQQSALIRMVGCKNFAELERKITKTRHLVQGHFQQIIGKISDG